MVLLYFKSKVLDYWMGERRLVSVTKNIWDTIFVRIWLLDSGWSNG